jgi:hypothetical protein
MSYSVMSNLRRYIGKFIKWYLFNGGALFLYDGFSAGMPFSQHDIDFWQNRDIVVHNN